VKLSDEGDERTKMDCHTVEDHNIIERYISERLSGPELEAFEQHYLGCNKCFAELKMRHAAAMELSSLPIQLQPSRSLWMALSWRWAFASGAVALALLVGILYLRPHEQARPELPQIAELQQPSAAVIGQLGSIDQIPPYIPGVIRGGETDPAMIKFQEGMNLYSMQKYADAVSPLMEAARLAPDRPIIPFYLGISYLVSGNTDGAIEQLQRVIAQDNPYSEEGHFFLAKAYLRKRNFSSARAQLQTVQSLHDAHATAAQDLLNRIQNF
jgi:tetratricopeptide (TPR) repeat protein